MNWTETVLMSKLGESRIHDMNNSSSSSLDDDVAGQAAGLRGIPRDERYLPCHYFDYIGGSSTEAYVYDLPDLQLVVES